MPRWLSDKTTGDLTLFTFPQESQSQTGVGIGTDDPLTGNLGLKLNVVGEIKILDNLKSGRLLVDDNVNVQGILTVSGSTFSRFFNGLTANDGIEFSDGSVQNTKSLDGNAVTETFVIDVALAGGGFDSTTYNVEKGMLRVS